ncbi:MAG: PASTA domain-containing protein [Acetatifactor sp.]|nr:PASTA domain-containing protein [Acetatifactor sp.]
MKLCMGCMESYDDEYSVCPHCGYAENSEPEEANQLRPGTILDNKYVVGKAIGHGAFGVTYLGYDAELERKIAVKEYMPGEFSNRVPGDANVIVYEGDKREQFESGLHKFMEEAKRLARFQDEEGIVQIYDCFLENNTAYIVMEYLNGETAKARVKREGRLNLEDSLEIVLPILRSLKKVHAEGIIHRDIAPDNIMLTKDGKAKLIDFGASRFATTGHSRSLTVLIKQGYAPVEQYNSRGDQGPWTDVYGLAATFYFLLTGKNPQDAMERKGKDLMKPPSKEGAEVNKNIDVAIMNAMNAGLDYRTKSMEDFEKQLLSIDEVTRIVEPHKADEVGKMPKWLMIILCTSVVALLVFVGLLVTGVLNFGRPNAEKFRLLQGKTYVPAFVNQTQDNAKVKAQENNVTLQFSDNTFSDEVEKYMIMSQNLPSGTEVMMGSEVYVVVSAGREPVDMPSVIGLESKDAIKLLEEKGLVVEMREVDSNMVAGSIVTQSTQAMSIVFRGDKIVLEASNGNIGEIDMEVEVAMPNLAGKKKEEAFKILEDLGLTIEQEPQNSNDVEEGYIISQSQQEGQLLHQGDSVKLVISLGRQKVNIPYVVFKAESEAKKMLEDLGLNVQISYEYVKEGENNVPKGNVLSQSIEDGTQVYTGTSVGIAVSLGLKENTPEPQWSDWQEGLPAGVSDANYFIETRTQYSYRDKSFTESSDPNLASQDYTLEVTIPVYSDYGSWSDWTTEAKSGSDLVKVESQTRYSYRDKVYKDNYSWGGWSEWQNEPVEASATRNVETREIPATYKTQYNYSRYVEFADGNGYKESTPGWWNGHYCQYEQRKSLDSPLPVQKVRYYADGTAFNQYSDSDGEWYNEGIGQVEATPAYTQYRYQDQKKTVSESWGDWTGYSTEVVTASDTREVRTQVYYRSASRSVYYMYSYSKWGGWSEFSDDTVLENGNREVRKRTLYRYKKK